MRQVRLFVAVNFPNEIKQVLGAFIQDLRQLPSDVKWVEVENLHLTIQFLGNVTEDQVPDIVNALSRSGTAVNPFCLNLIGVGVFPSIHRPRVLWAGISGETDILSRLHRRVQKELAQLGFEPEKRHFSPHLTLARIRSPLGFSAFMERSEKIAGKYDKFGTAKITSLDLMRSELKPKGPKYFVLDRIPLSTSSLV